VTALQIPAAGGAPVEQVVAKKGEILPSVFTGENGKEYAAVLNFNRDPVVGLSDSRAS